MEFLGPILKVLISLASSESGHWCPGGSHAHPSEDLLLPSWNKSEQAPGGNVSCGCSREEREEWKTSCFVCVLHTYCSINESMLRVEFALFISGMDAGLHCLSHPGSCHGFRKYFVKVSLQCSAPCGLNWNSTPCVVIVIIMVRITVECSVWGPGTALLGRAAPATCQTSTQGYTANPVVVGQGVGAGLTVQRPGVSENLRQKKQCHI